MKHNKFIFIFISIILALAVAVFAYFVSHSASDDIVPEPEIQSEVSSVAPVYTNDLTGLPIDKELVDNRPVCVMINNIKVAQPLLGVSKSDMIYECLVEGGITRLMACFKDPYAVEKIGSVRSARPYYVKIASGMNGIYVHEGGSAEALNMLSSGSYHNATDFSLALHGDYMWRDSWRKKNLGHEHSVLTSGEKLKQGISDLGIDTKYKPSYDSKLKFSAEENSLKNGEVANKLVANFSGYKSTTFDYDAQNETYLISQFGTSQKDDTIQNSKQNVIAFYIPTHERSAGSVLQAIDLVGSGEGYYMSHGKITKITWHRDSEADSPFYYKTADGHDLVMYPGQTYVCCVPTSTGSIQYS